MTEQTAELGFKAGRVVYFTAGSYSDHRVVGHFVALRDVHEVEVRLIESTIRATHKLREEAYWEDANATDDEPDFTQMFVAAMVATGALIEIHPLEIHTDDSLTAKGR